MIEEPDLKKYAQEVDEMQTLPAASVELPPLAALAIISHIQLAIRHPGIADSEFAQIAIDVAKQLQNLFNEDSETYKVLELGWNPEADFLAPSARLFDKFRDQPCTDLPASEVRERDPQLVEAIRIYFERQGIDLDADSDCEEPKKDTRESFDDYIGEEPLDKFQDPEETRATYKPEPRWFKPNEHIENDRFDENFYHGKTFSQRCRDEGIDPCSDLY